MKLDKLHVSQNGSGPICCRKSVSGGSLWISCFAINLGAATRGDQYGPSTTLDDAAAMLKLDSRYPAVFDE
jgi:hypothetical protein